MDKELIRLIGAATGGLVVGGAAGYLITKARLQKKYAALADEEIESVKKVYNLNLEETLTPEEHALMVQHGTEDVEQTAKGFRGRIVSEDRAGDPLFEVQPATEDIEGLKELLEDYNGSIDGPQFPRVTFAPQPEEVDPFFLDRDSREPYIISVDEFHEKEHYTKAMLTYHEPDQTLVDENQQVIEDIENAIGPEALQNFGNHSGSPDVVYIRREENDIDFEITRDKISFQEALMGGLPSEDRLRKRDDD